MINQFHTPELLEEIKNSAIVKQFPAETEIISEHSHIKVIPIVNSGLIGVYQTEADGKEILVYYISPGESCIMSFLSGMHNSTSKIKAIAEEDCELMLIPIEKVSEWVSKYKEWNIFVFDLYNKRFEALLEVLNEIAFQNMDERVIRHLQRRGEVSNTKTLRITHQQIADELGSKREVISRILKQLEKQGSIELQRNKILLL